MPTTLAQLLSTTMQAAPALRLRRPALERAAAGAPARPSFRASLAGTNIGVIAEVKRRSPSAGPIRPDLDPASRARAYVEAGAVAVSVLTDGPFFGGSLEDLAAVASAVPAPLLRKDFILYEEQLLEARIAGASAVLLIVRALEAARLTQLIAETTALGLDALVEAHDEGEVGQAIGAGAQIVGVNSRDLATLTVDPVAAWALLARIPEGIVAVAESGLASVADVERAADAGADAVLIGTALSRADDPAGLVAALAGVRRRGR